MFSIFFLPFFVVNDQMFCLSVDLYFLKIDVRTHKKAEKHQ